VSDDVGALDRAWERSRVSMSERVRRLRSKVWHIGQCAISAGLAWFLAHDVIGHPKPFFAPIVAVVCLGTSYGQRLRRVGELTVGVAVGVFLADILLQVVGTGPWQITVVVAIAMSVALLLNGSPMFVNQAAVQGIVVVTVVAGPGYALTRWLDAVVGGAVALVAASVVPQAPLRRPRQQAATDGDVERALDVLAAARGTDQLMRELQEAADEGLSVLASSPFRRRHQGGVRRMAELVGPLDHAMRNTRVLVRRTAVSAHHRLPFPRQYAVLCEDLAAAADEVADELAARRMAESARPALLRVGEATARTERVADLSADVVLAQIRSIIVDLLEVTGLDVLEATDALPRERA
jgi:uncharacterized membrane protein YgaE (UPF0421/DUF939 family)